MTGLDALVFWVTGPDVNNYLGVTKIPHLLYLKKSRAQEVFLHIFIQWLFTMKIGQDYYMSKMSRPILYSNLIYEIGPTARGCIP